jgi:very-short-patch-repair endonuclease
VLDFYCPEHKLAIEVDGGVHDETYQAERDVERTRFLSERGIRVLRVRNEEVLTALDVVLSRIAHATQPPPANETPIEPEGTLSCSPPSLAGEGPGVGGSSADAT